jgi:tagatose-1,6-bisphosphate aldolase
VPVQPAITLDEVRGAAATVSRFMSENCDVFEAADQFAYERGVTAKLSKMMISRLSKRVQKPLTAFF